MKRCIKWLINWFVQWIDKMEWEEKMGFGIGGLLGIVLGVIAFMSFDKVPADPLDYEPMEKQVVAIQQDPDLLLNTDCNISIKGGIITVELENDECKVIAKYDQNFKVLSNSREDKSLHWLAALGLAVITGGFVYCLASVVLILVIILLKELLKWIIKQTQIIRAKIRK